MDRPTPESAESIGDIFHKRKEAKEKTVEQKTINHRPLDNSTIVEGSTPSNDSKTQKNSSNRQKSPSVTSRKKALEAAEIDSFLDDLVIEGLLVDEFVPWAAKACYTIGVMKMNRLAIKARSGRQPQKLFAYMVNGAVRLEQKRLFYSEQ